ncbi:hypothetical protein [Streptomyces sp. NBC_01744]|uniref:hypothetical protein n=1 Tax=Streptomyces sp. NBC_01744 TaxID=2975927 RepID=UPI003D9A2C2E|nr:hypothetical protein OIE70_31100 [Streptomyces sp. NBC_01744]
MLTPQGIAFATPFDLGDLENYRRFCLAAGLDPVPDGYGLLLVTDEAGDKKTLVTDDVEYVRAIVGATPEVLSGLELPQDKFLVRDDWPDSWA